MPLLSTRGASSTRGFGFLNKGLFQFAIASNQSNANLRTLAVNAGWNQTDEVVATINGGITVSSTSTGTPALAINGSFPGGITLINNGTILGKGGKGGDGGWGPAHTLGTTNGSPGAAGGPALSVSVAASINNGSGTICGGGGGGGGGGLYDELYSQQRGGGGGGGGNGSGEAGISGRGDIYGNYGAAGGTFSGGSGGSGGQGLGGTGGSGGSNASNGNAGVTSANQFANGAGGAGGAAVSGNSNITWVATGTRLGAIT